MLCVFFAGHICLPEKPYCLFATMNNIKIKPYQQTNEVLMNVINESTFSKGRILLQSRPQV